MASLGELARKELEMLRRQQEQDRQRIISVLSGWDTRIRLPIEAGDAFARVLANDARIDQLYDSLAKG
jgi:hypothetical protein